MFSNVEVRHLLAVDILAEELNFTRAALRLNISQSALSRQITGFTNITDFTSSLATSDEPWNSPRRHVFVKEARSALLLIERAGHLAHAAHEGAVNVLTIGLSPCVEQDWISGLLTIRLPLYPRIRIRWRSQFPIDLVRSVLAGELDLALVAAPPRILRSDLCCFLVRNSALFSQRAIQPPTRNPWYLRI